MSSISDSNYPGTVTDQVSEPLDARHHDVPERHVYGSAFLFPGNPQPIVVDGLASPGISDTPAREDHVHQYFPTARAGTMSVQGGQTLSMQFNESLQKPPIVIFAQAPTGTELLGADSAGFSLRTQNPGEIVWIAVEQTD